MLLLESEGDWIYYPITLWDCAMDVIYALFAIFGTVWIYGINEKDDGQDFIERFTCLTIPIIVQCLLIGLAMLDSMFLDLYIMPSADTHTNIISFIMVLSIEIYFYIRIYSAVMRVSH